MLEEDKTPACSGMAYKIYLHTMGVCLPGQIWHPG